VKAQPVCSIIVPSYRSAQTIQASLTALLSQDLRPLEIIVVDSSPDETGALVRREFPEVKLIRMEQQTDPALARNIGAQHAQGAILAFIDADCVAPPNWLRRLCEALEQGYDAAGGAILNGNGQSLVSWAGYLCEFREFLPGGIAHDARNLTLGNAAYRRAAFRASGGFPAGYFPQEDQVFHHAFAGQGGRIRLDPSIAVAHTHRTEREAFLDHQRQIGQVNARVVCHLDLPGAWLARRGWLARLSIPALVLMRFVRTMLAGWRVERMLVVRRPVLAWLCWLGMCAWGQGFLAGTQGHSRVLDLSHADKSH